MKKIKVPTGHILIIDGEHGPLECLSIGDYGKEKNIKADFMGLTNDINGVPHGALLPLEKKWVITISSQYGCSMGCRFCDVPKVGPGINATFHDMLNQVNVATSLHPEVKHSERINLHYARMGEPTFNPAVIDVTYFLAGYHLAFQNGFHPVVSTMMPKYNRRLKAFLKEWMFYKNVVAMGNAGLQLSINTTDPERREFDFNRNALSLEEISDMVFNFDAVGRKITLNFALSDAPIDAKYLKELFDPEVFLCKITPMHKTAACTANGIETKDGYTQYYPYAKVEDELKAEGFDVIVFVPSLEEDESRITCGNAILAKEQS